MPDLTPTYGLPMPNDTDSLKAAVKDIPRSLATKIEATIATLTGVSPGSVPMMRAAYVALNTNANGDAAVTFPVAFPNNCLGISFSQAGDPAQYGAVIIRLTGQPTKTAAIIRIYQTNGVPLANVAGVTVTYTAMGN